MKSRSESNILTRLIFYAPARQTVDEKLKLHIIVIEPSQYMSSQINI